jgi:predicted regulator of Ras-like GTPase activity (Roadblock/LC7/MglB family)
VSDFDAILRHMVDSVPGATGAVFADWEGESIGAVANAQPVIEARIAGAQWGVVWSELVRTFARGQLGRPDELIVDGARGAALVRRVTDHYYVVMTVDKDAQLGRARAELSRGAARLAAEM